MNIFNCKGIGTMIAWCFVVSNISGQIIFQKTIGGSSTDVGYAVQQTKDDGYIIAGVTYSFSANNEQDIYVIKTDQNGDTLWTKVIGGPYDDFGYAVAQTVDDGFVIAGYHEINSGIRNLILLKMDPFGDTLWTKLFAGIGSNGYALIQTADSGFAITGQTTSAAVDILLVKTDKDGNILFSKTYGSPESDFGTSVFQTNDGGYILTGYTLYGGNSNILLIKTDAQGDTLWTRVLGTNNANDIGASVIQIPDGSYIIGGTLGHVGGSNACLIKTDAAGDTLWTKIYGGNVDSDGWDMQQTSDSGFVLVARAQSFGISLQQFYLIKTDTKGGAIWSRTFSGTTGNGHAPKAVQQTNDNGYIMTGITAFGNGGGSDLYLIKTDSVGNGICNQGSPPLTTAIAGLSILNIPLTTTTGGSFNGTDSLFINSGGVFTTLCTSVGIPLNENTPTDFVIVPNPVIDNFAISFPYHIYKCDVEIFDNIGRLLIKENFSDISQAEILFEHHAPGIYFVNIYTEKGMMVEKIIKL